MRRTTICLDEEQAHRLRRLAAEEGRSFEDVVREALDTYLVQRGAPATSGAIGPRRQLPRDQWRHQFEALLERMRSRTPAVPTEEEADAIEADITAARTEVRLHRRRARAAKEQAARASDAGPAT